MNQPLTTLYLAAVALLSLAFLPGCGGEKAKAEKSAKDLAEARVTAIAYNEALYADDAAAIKTLTVGGKDDVNAANAEMIASVEPFQKALFDKFGNDIVSKHPDWRDHAELLLETRQEAQADIENAPGVATGDTVTFTIGKGKNELILKKIDGKWKVDLSNEAGQEAMEAKRRTAQIRQATEDLKADKFDSVDAVRKATILK